jgi:elongation factor Ts
VAVESTADAAALSALGKQIAMHVAAANPTALDITSVDPVALQRERAILTEQAAASGKPVQVVEKMVEGRLRKFYEETVLLEQLYVVDGESRVKDVVAKAAKDLGAPVKLAGFVRYALGEGVEKKQEDFAAEVAAQLKRD